ncbi:Dicer-like protein, partial [Thalictrum thalictroides]
AVRILLNGDPCEDIDVIEAEVDLTDGSLANQYLSLVATVVDSNFIRDGVGFDSSILEALKDPIFSKKLLVLIHILSSCRIQQDIKCIVFVNRIIVARTLSYILMNLKCLPFWKCQFLVGYHSGLKNMSRKKMNSIIEKFRSGELNLLVATSVGEEGLDIQTCCLVIRFDPPNSVASFIQSKGRARMLGSEYAFLVERENQNDLNLIKTFLLEEDRMNEEITCRTSTETYDVLEELNYRVPSTGASISAGYSVSLLHRYCSKLPRDEYFNPKPEFFFFDDNGGVFCRIVLPSNAPIHQVDSPPQSSKQNAKKIACLRACKELHLLGALTDHLLPVQDDKLNEESVESDSCEVADSSRGELHEMLSPSVLKTPWNSENSLLLNFYFIEFVPVPNDRLYQKFGLFVKTPLPTEAQTMELDLHLAHGRIVKTKLVPLGVIECDADEIVQAQTFQELYLKIILDREEFFADFVPLEKKDSIQSKPSNSYLLLPVRQNKHEHKLAVDWELIKRCLSSPVFGAQKNALDSGLVAAGKPLILADGPASTSDVVNSLIFTPHNKLFFFVDGILSGMDANSPFTDASSANYLQHYTQKFGINILHPKQPLLKAKQLFSLHNLLHNRVQGNTVTRELEEHFVELPPEICSLKIVGFSKDIGSSLSLLPSLMHRLENLLVAIELKSVFSDSFVEGSEVTAHRVLEAITTEKCMERFSLERLEVLGDAFLKYAVGRHVFLSNETVDEGQLTRRRSSIVNNSHLYKLAIRSNLQVYIRDENFDPSQFFALGRPCKVVCSKNTEMSIHFRQRSGSISNGADSSNVKCSKGHHWLHKKTVADIVEALVGAFIVDSGFKAAIAFLKWVGIEVDFEASQVSSICMASNSYMSLFANIDISALENSLGYRFLHKGLLVQAFLHPSYNKHSGGCYQRLEFLGDAVLDYLITSYLFSVYPKLKPGQLTDLRSVTVNNNAFARVAVCRSLHTYLISDSEALSEAVQKFVALSHTSPAEKDMVERPTCPKALGDLVESSVGAILLDSGFNLNLVWKIMLSFLDPIMSFTSLQLNPVRELTELCQSRNWELQFSYSKRGGGFVVDAWVNGKSVHATGCGTNLSKKAAERTAARKIFLKLKAEGFLPKKSKSLEKLLKSCVKEKAKLIGYDENPTQEVLLDAIQLDNLQIQERSPNACNTPHINPTNKRPITNEGSENHCHKSAVDKSPVTNLQNGGIPPSISNISRLFELCTVKFWKPPMFECVKEEGLSHLKLFTFKVTVEIIEDKRTILECFSDPRPKKKAAQEHAAEGALWYLKHQGYLHNDK